jgi:hypothetical protein
MNSHTFPLEHLNKKNEFSENNALIKSYRPDEPGVKVKKEPLRLREAELVEKV